MGKGILKEFIQRLQNRVIVAVSLIVYNSKPADVTGEMHAESIQRLVYENWAKDNHVSSFENKIIELQHEKLFKDINELLQTNLNIPWEDVNLFSRLEDKARLLISKLDESFPDVRLEDTIVDSVSDIDSEDTQEGLIPAVYSEDTQNGSFYGVGSEADDFMSGVCFEEDEQNVLIPGVCLEEYLCEKLEENNSFDNINLFKNYVSFIQAIVQLKFPVFSRGYLTVDIIHNFLDKYVKNENLHKFSIKNVISNSDVSDSGELGVCPKDDLNVDKIRIIINSTRTEYLLNKCLASAIYFAYKNIHNNTDKIFYHWHGSLMEYLCSVLEDISFHPACTDYLSKLILKSLDDIWSSEDFDKHITWEHQQHILAVFCANSHVCESVIDFVLVKFDVLINLINKIQIGSVNHLVSNHLIEKLPHFTKFSCIVMKKLHFYKAADIDCSENQNKYNKSIKVTDLWKSKWSVNHENQLDKKNKSFKDLLKKWKDVCEKLIIISATNFPLISVYIWDLLSSLQDWNHHEICSLLWLLFSFRPTNLNQN